MQTCLINGSVFLSLEHNLGIFKLAGCVSLQKLFSIVSAEVEIFPARVTETLNKIKRSCPVFYMMISSKLFGPYLDQNDFPRVEI